MKYYVIAGEASGDLHGSNLMKSIRSMDADADFRCWGGELMQAEGCEIVKHYKDLAFMGFFEVIANLPTILRNIAFCKADIIAWKPDAIIFIDYPGFNLRIAEFGRINGFKTVYYISPQIWAWKESRLKNIRRDIDLMLVILPFEKEYYSQRGMDVEFVGHPLLDAIGKGSWRTDSWKEKMGIPADKKLVALLPGSRDQEISTMLPLMLEATAGLSQFHFVLAVAPSQNAESYQRWISGRSDITLLKDETYPILSNADAALVTSGTATLEAALFEVPEVVCYKANRISYWIARLLVKIRFISLVNLVMDREVVKELIQDDLKPALIRSELLRLFDQSSRHKMMTDYAELKSRLGGEGASKKAAGLIFNFLNKTNQVDIK